MSQLLTSYQEGTKSQAATSQRSTTTSRINQLSLAQLNGVVQDQCCRSAGDQGLRESTVYHGLLVVFFILAWGPPMETSIVVDGFKPYDYSFFLLQMLRN